MPIVDVPGQGLVEFPDDMSDEDIGLAISRQRASGIKKPKPADYGFGSEMLSGLTFGFGDELRSAITGEPIESIRAGQQAYRRESPAASTIANIAGSIPTLAIPGAGAANIARGIGMAGKVGRAATTLGTGAAYGGLTGAGEATEGQRGTGAAQGAALGAATAPIGAAIGRGIQAVGQRRASNLPADLQAQAILAGRMKASGIAPTSVAPREGQTLAELSRPLETLAGSVVRRSPESAGKFSRIVEQRKSERKPELMATVSRELTGGEGQTVSQIEKITQAQRQSAAPYYRQAFDESQPIQSPLIDDLMTLEPFQAAYKRAQAISKLERDPIPEYVPGQPMTLRAANYLKQGLDEVVYGAKRDPASSIGKTQLGLIDQLRGDFVREIDEYAPESYKLARSIYAGGARNQEASEAGAKAWDAGPEYVSDFLSGASEAEKAAFRAGANASLSQKASKLGANSEAFRRLMDTDNSRAVVQQLSTVEGPSKVPALAGMQRAQADFEQRMMGGSQTAERRAADEMLAGEALPQQIAREGVKGTILNRAIQGVVDRATTGGDKVISELDALLLNPSRTANMETLRRLGLLDEQLKRQAGVRAGAYAAGAGGTSGLLGGE